MKTSRNPIERVWSSRKRLAGGADIRRRNELVEDNRDLARKIAHRWQRQCTEPYEDLEQIAVIGLIKAVDRFNPSENAAFSSFAVPYIQGEIQHFLRDQWGTAPKIPRRAIEEHSKVRRIQRDLAKRGREVSEQEVAEGLGIPQGRWQWISEARTRKPMISLDESPIAVAQEEVSGDSEREWLYGQLERMPELQRNCISERFFAQLEIEEIAQHQRISPQLCRVLIDQALESLREAAAQEQHG